METAQFKGIDIETVINHFFRGASDLSWVVCGTSRDFISVQVPSLKNAPNYLEHTHPWVLMKVKTFYFHCK